ncbi:MAG: respiratory nitrate reductase subunit gamma [Thermoleophilia bacterium]
MSGLTIAFSVFFYISVDIFLVGLLLKIWKYVATPAPLKIPQTPAPATAAGVGGRMFKEVVFFRSLFRSNKLLWLGGYVLHLTLLFIFMKHLRFLFPATPVALDYLVNFDLYTGFILLGSLAFLLILRLVIDRHLYISVFTDFFLLGLLMCIATTGLLSRFWEGGNIRANLPEIKGFVGGLFSFNPGAVPTNRLFLTHFTLVMTLLIYFPFSKLVHAVGIFFSPTRNQIDNARSQRWVSRWVGNKPRAAGPQDATPAQPAFAVTEKPLDS